MVKIFSLVLVLLAWSGCSAGITKCLETPISSKVSQNALETCQTALQENLHRQDIFHIYLGLLRVRQQYDEIETWSRRILDQAPGRTDATYNLAFALRKKGNCAEAIKHYQAYATANTKDPDPYYGLGLCFEDLKQAKQARQNYQAYILREKRQSQQVWVTNARARIQALSRSPLASAPPRAATSPTAGAASSHPRPAIRPIAPRPALRTPAPRPALRAPAPAQRSPSPSAPAPTKTADCSAFERAFTADPFALEAYDKFATCAFAAGRYPEIIKRIRVALRDNPEFHRGWMHLGKALKATGDMTQSKIALTKACNAGVAEACGL